MAYFSAIAARNAIVWEHKCIWCGSWRALRGQKMLAVVTRGKWQSISVSIYVLFLPKPFVKRKYGNVFVPIMDRNESNCAPRNTEARKTTVDVHVNIFAIRHDAHKRTSKYVQVMIWCAELEAMHEWNQKAAAQ